MLFRCASLPFRAVALSRGIVIRGGTLSHSRRAMAQMAQRQHPRLLSSRLCQYGGCSRVSRRLLWRKSRNSAAVPVLAACHNGGCSAIIPDNAHH